MHKYKIRIGSFESSYSAEEIEAKFRDALAEVGVISEVENRGLSITKITNQGRPGFISHSVMKTVMEKPGLSERKIGNRLPDLTFAQVKGALRRLVKEGDIQGVPKRSGRYRYFLYSATDQGRSKYEAMNQAEADEQFHGRAIFHGFKKLGYKAGSKIDRDEIRKICDLTPVELRYGLAWLKDQGIVESYKEDDQFVERIKEKR